LERSKAEATAEAEAVAATDAEAVAEAVAATEAEAATETVAGSCFGAHANKRKASRFMFSE
jgi:hypothetical protein